jgi:asparagine synthase (glutamine-hydrolysing)
VGSFFVVISPHKAQANSKELFRRGLERSERLKSQEPSSIIDVMFARAASFARYNGSGGRVATDAATGCWLLAAGTWFHTDGYVPGDEAKLLSRMVEAGVARVAQNLEGFFVIVYCDSRTHEVFVITDVMGSRHCFIRTVGEVTALSTSSLLLASLGGTTLDALGCEEFLRAGVIYEDRTLFREVKKLAPATIYRFASGKLAGAQAYWQMADLNPEALDGERAIRQLSEKLVSAVKRIAEVYGRPVCDLTGGYDSRSVVAAFLSAGIPFETTVTGAESDADVVISKGLSKLIGARNWHFEPSGEVSIEHLKYALRLTDGECDLVEYARIHSLHRELSESFGVSVNGSYGEIARGYWWSELLFPKIGKRGQLDLYKLAAKRYATDLCSPQLFPPGLGLDMVEHFAVMISRLNKGLIEWPNTAQMDHAYLMLRMQRWQGRLASSTDQIWPCVSPFIFRSVLDTALQTSARARKNSRLIRSLLEHLQPRLAEYPLERGHPAMALNLKSWPRFLPASWHYAEKFGVKANEKWSNRISSSLDSEPARLQLWRDEETQETLDPVNMRLNSLIDPVRLNNFLESSREPQFAFDQQWRRVLTLEMALRFLREVSLESAPRAALSAARTDNLQQAEVGNADRTEKGEEDQSLACA